MPSGLDVRPLAGGRHSPEEEMQLPTDCAVNPRPPLSPPLLTG